METTDGILERNPSPGGSWIRVAPLCQSPALSILRRTRPSPSLLPLAFLPSVSAGLVLCPLAALPSCTPGGGRSAVSQVCGRRWASLLKGRLADESLKESGGAAHTELKWETGCRMFRPPPPRWDALPGAVFSVDVESLIEKKRSRPVLPSGAFHCAPPAALGSLVLKKEEGEYVEMSFGKKVLPPDFLHASPTPSSLSEL